MKQGGSIQRRIVAPELLEERAKCNFDAKELSNLLDGTPEARAMKERIISDQEKHPELRNTHKFYELTPREMQENMARILDKKNETKILTDTRLIQQWLPCDLSLLSHVPM